MALSDVEREAAASAAESYPKGKADRWGKDEQFDQAGGDSFWAGYLAPRKWKGDG